MTTKLEDTDLLYSATDRCSCGAGLAYPLHFDPKSHSAAWVCSSVLKGDTGPEGHDSFPWAFYKIREETSINNSSGGSTRPPGTIARTQGKATCPQCSRKWQSEPYDATTQRHHWFPGPCPACGYAVGAEGSWSSKDGKPIDVRLPAVVIKTPIETT